MRFPVILKTEPDRSLDARLYYEVAANGVFQVKETDSYRAVTRVEGGVPGLHAGREELEIRFPRLPSRLLDPVLAFFRAVHRAHDGEAIVILFHRPETGAYRVAVPQQTVPGWRDSRGRWRGILSLRYGEVKRPEGFRRFGSIHSHAEAAACASATDCHDERFDEGLHVIYGHLHREEPSRSATFVANGVRFSLAPERVLEPARGLGRPRAAWMARVRREETGLSYSRWGRSWGAA